MSDGEILHLLNGVWCTLARSDVHRAHSACMQGQQFGLLRMAG